MNVDYSNGTPNIISEKPVFEVFIAPDKPINWPPKCSLCGSNYVTQIKNGIVTYQSGEYLVARQYKDFKIENIPFCDNCIKRTTATKSENILVLGGIVTGIVMAVMISILLFNICTGIMLGVVTAVGILLVGKYAIVNKSEADSVEIEVGTQLKFVGKRTPPWLKFKFRNKNYAIEFAYNNNVLGPHICNRCNNPLLYNQEQSRWYCLNCMW